MVSCDDPSSPLLLTRLSDHELCALYLLRECASRPRREPTGPPHEVPTSLARMDAGLLPLRESGRQSTTQPPPRLPERTACRLHASRPPADAHTRQPRLRRAPRLPKDVR